MSSCVLQVAVSKSTLQGTRTQRNGKARTPSLFSLWRTGVGLASDARTHIVRPTHGPFQEAYILGPHLATRTTSKTPVRLSKETGQHLLSDGAHGTSGNVLQVVQGLKGSAAGIICYVGS